MVSDFDDDIQVHIKPLCYRNCDPTHWVRSCRQMRSVLSIKLFANLYILQGQFDALTFRFNIRLIHTPPNPAGAYIMRFFTFLAVTGLAIVGSAKPTKKLEPPAQVEVTLTPQSGSIVQVSVKNVSKKKFDFFQRGSLLDENPVHKLQVQSSSGWFTIEYQLRSILLLTIAGGAASFIGVHPRVRQDGTLHKESFRSLKPGKSFEYTLDAAKMYDLTAGGAFEISAEGILPYSQPGKKKISGEATYKSNTVTVNVNSDEAKHAKRDLERRNRMQPDCTAGRREQAANALAVCSNIAFVAGEMALRGNLEQ